MDHYATLGVSKTATQDEIKRAYRKLAKQYHPDSATGDAEQFKKINEAYSILGVDRRRQEYDHAPQETVRPSQNNNFAERDIHEFFRDVFGASAGFHHSYHQPPRNRDLRATVEIELDTVFAAQRRTLHLKTGRSERTVEVDIPAGVNDGATIRYRGYGQDILTQAPPGDLIVTIHVRNVRGFARNASDLHSEIAVDAVDAMLGGEVEFENLDGRRILVRIPPGAQPGQQLRLAGRGLPNAQGNRGSLLLTVKITVPKNLTDEQKKLLEQFRNG